MLYANNYANVPIHITMPRVTSVLTRVSNYRCLRKTAPFTQAFAPESDRRNSSPAPDFVFLRLIPPGALLSGGVFFSQMPV